jgi:hypothetical protein
MGNGNCFDVIGGWTVGAAGECFHENIGFRLGQHGYKYGVLQVWHQKVSLSSLRFSSACKLRIKIVNLVFEIDFNKEGHIIKHGFKTIYNIEKSKLLK